MRVNAALWRRTWRRRAWRRAWWRWCRRLKVLNHFSAWSTICSASVSTNLVDTWGQIEFVPSPRRKATKGNGLCRVTVYEFSRALCRPPCIDTGICVPVHEAALVNRGLAKSRLPIGIWRIRHGHSSTQLFQVVGRQARQQEFVKLARGKRAHTTCITRHGQISRVLECSGIKWISRTGHAQRVAIRMV
jgi:hypothetical protein